MADYGIDNAKIDSVDTSKWRCKFCPEEEGVSGKVEGFFGYSEEGISQRFKNTEAEGESGQASVSADVQNNNLNSQSTIVVDGVGDDNVRTAIGYQDYDALQADFSYSRSNHFFGEGAKSLYDDLLSDTLELPPAWLAQSNTGAMGFSNLYPISNYQERKTLETEVRNIFGEEAVALSVHFRQQLRSGTGWTSGSILNDVTALPSVRNDRLRELTINAAVPFIYQNGAGSVGLEYFKSEFDNDYQNLSWENPFTSALAGSERGNLASSPDNQYQSWRFFTRYSLDKHRFELSYGQGQGEQDDEYLAYTTNTLLLTQALPKSSYDGEVETRYARLRWDYRINEQWQLKTRYRFNERDNVSNILEYEPVMTDSLVQGVIENLRYSHKKTDLDLNFDWRWRPQTRFGYRYEYQSFKRQRESTGEYDSHALAFYWKERWSSDVKTRAKILVEERDEANHETSMSPSDNSLYRDFTLADRLRNAAELNMDWQYSSNVQLSANGVFQKDDFKNTQIGVKDSEERSFGLNLSWLISKDLSTNASLQRSWMSWLMAGSAQQSVPTWNSEQKDQYDVFTLGLRRSGIHNDTVINEYDGLRSDVHTIQSYLSYQWRPEWQLRFEALYERYQSDNPVLIGVNTLPRVIGNYIQDENYSNWLFGLRLQYQIPE
jgi:MtrB/PioB family decaheme-associated outer membrane protein